MEARAAYVRDMYARLLQGEISGTDALEASQQMLQILTPEQQSKLEARRREMQVRDRVEKVRRDSIRAASNTKPTVCR